MHKAFSWILQAVISLSTFISLIHNVICMSVRLEWTCPSPSPCPCSPLPAPGVPSGGTPTSTANRLAQHRQWPAQAHNCFSPTDFIIRSYWSYIFVSDNYIWGGRFLWLTVSSSVFSLQGIQFYTQIKTVTSQWKAEDATTKAAAVTMPTMR